jgi:hypothetical protein
VPRALEHPTTWLDSGHPSDILRRLSDWTRRCQGWLPLSSFIVSLFCHFPLSLSRSSPLSFPTSLPQSIFTIFFRHLQHDFHSQSSQSFSLSRVGWMVARLKVWSFCSTQLLVLSVKSFCSTEVLIARLTVLSVCSTQQVVRVGS